MKAYLVKLNYNIIGKVYLSSHGVWVAEPSWANYSCSFRTRDEAIIELMIHSENQKRTNKDLVIH